jgi:hypothetical protein
MARRAQGFQRPALRGKAGKQRRRRIKADGKAHFLQVVQRDRGSIGAIGKADDLGAGDAGGDGRDLGAGLDAIGKDQIDTAFGIAAGGGAQPGHINRLKAQMRAQRVGGARRGKDGAGFKPFAQRGHRASF